MTNDELEYKQSIASELNVNADQIDLFWKGRVGLYALLKSFGISASDEVIIPAFTCVVVPNAVIYLGAKPVYVDVSTNSLNTTFEQVAAKVTEHTKCIVIQNTFGLSSEVESIVNYAKEKGILTIEDCTHGFGGTYNGRKNGTYCDAAFYSTQWNKPFSTGIGGFSLLNNLDYKSKLDNVCQVLKIPGAKERNMLAVLIRVKKYLLNDFTYWSALKIYRKLSKSGAVVGSSQDIEISTTDQPEDYFLKSTKVQNKVGLKELKRINVVLKLRKQNGIALNKFFKENGLWHYQERDIHNHSFLKYPIFVKDKNQFQLKAEKAKIKLGDWFLSPIHPVTENLEDWGLKTNEYPIAQSLSGAILNLTTEDKDINKVLRFIEKNKKDFMAQKDVGNLPPHMK